MTQQRASNKKCSSKRRVPAKKRPPNVIDFLSAKVRLMAKQKRPMYLLVDVDSVQETPTGFISFKAGDKTAVISKTAAYEFAFDLLARAHDTKAGDGR